MRLNSFEFLSDMARGLSQPRHSPMDGLMRSLGGITVGFQPPDLGRILGPSYAMIEAVNSTSRLPHNILGLNWLTGMADTTSAIDRWMAPFLQIHSWMADSTREVRARHARFAEVINELDWPPPLRMSSSAMSEVLALAEDVGIDGAREQVEALILAAYDDATLDAMIQEWQAREGLPAHALPHMIEAVGSFRDHRYVAAVSTGIPAVEAIVFEAWAPTTAKEATHGNMRDFAANAIGGRGAEPLDRSTARYVKDVHFANARRGQTIPPTPGRHAVVHGFHPLPGTPTNALRVIILLDLLSNAFAFVAAPRGKVVHLPCCVVGQRLNWSTRRVFHSLAVAEHAGLRRAKCCPDRGMGSAHGRGAKRSPHARGG